MKVKSEGKLEIVLDEDKIRKASEDDTMYRFEMLKETTKIATLVEVSCDDHREIKQMLVDNGKTLAKIATAIGILLALLTGASVVI